jgi:hypothetical protein
VPAAEAVCRSAAPLRSVAPGFSLAKNQRWPLNYRRSEFSPTKESGLRLSPNKIEYLADRILSLMQDSQLIHLGANVETVWKTVADTIFANMREEEDIDAEVDELLTRHKYEIQGQEMDVSDLRRKFKREVARKRGFTL